MIEKVNQILSVKVKLILDEKGKRELVKLCKAYKDAMNFVFVSSFKAGNLFKVGITSNLLEGIGNSDLLFISKFKTLTPFLSPL